MIVTIGAPRMLVMFYLLGGRFCVCVRSRKTGVSNEPAGPQESLIIPFTEAIFE
jgi:hypothetical protein